jgi:hypothetical protein
VAIFIALAFTSTSIATAQDTVDNLREQLDRALAAIAELQERVARLEGERAGVEIPDDLEAQLQALLGEEPAALPSTRSKVFPSAYNPRIGVFVEALAEGGNADEKLGTDGDRFSLREVEVDMTLPVSPFAEATFIAAFEDRGAGEFESRVEEAYADVSVAALTGSDTGLRLRVGRFRLSFGVDNILHTHDLPQADRPLAVTRQLGGEGLVGDGLQLTLPLSSSEARDGLISATSASLALVNGDLFTGDDALLSDIATSAGLILDSDAPLIVARATHFAELSELSDIEFGVSWLTGLGSNAVTTDVMTKVEPSLFAVDVTWRSRNDETGMGSWLVSAQSIRSEVNYHEAATPGFPTGLEQTDGYWITVQRQVAANTYWGMRLGSSEVLGTQDSISALSPYVSWYADEFFRVRLQAQQLRTHTSGVDATAYRGLLQLSWNFGAHKPHPYWTSR